jgi:hypothetical protein
MISLVSDNLSASASRLAHSLHSSLETPDITTCSHAHHENLIDYFSGTFFLSSEGDRISSTVCCIVMVK